MPIQRPSIFRPILILVGAAILLAMMRLSASFLLPILLSLFFATLLTPVYTRLKRWRVPSGLALLLTLALLILVVILLLLLIGNALVTLGEGLAGYTEQLSQRQTELETQLESLIPQVDSATVSSVVDPEKLTNILMGFLSAARQIASSAMLIFLLTIFFLLEGPQFATRMKQAYGENHPFTQNMTDLGPMTINYFVLRLVVNGCTATATGLMLWFFGIPHAGLWTVLTFFLSFIPYIGAFFAAIPPLILAYAQGGLGLVVVIGLLMVVINSITENIVAPMVMGKGLSLSPTVVFISYIFWMFILGGPGALLAVPLTMAIIVFMGSFEETRGFALMLVTDPEPITRATITEEAAPL